PLCSVSRMYVKCRFGFRPPLSGESRGGDRQEEQPSAEAGERYERPDRRSIEWHVHGKRRETLPPGGMAAQNQPGRQDERREVVEADIETHQHAGEQADGNGTGSATTTAAPQNEDGGAKTGDDSEGG